MSVFSLAPTSQTVSTGQQNYGQQTTQQQNGATSNIYTPGQQGLQKQVATGFGQLANGQTSTAFTAPQSAFDAYNQYFQNFIAPGLATQYGAGSPQIGEQQTLGSEQLAGNLYEQGIGNEINALNSAAGFATTPVGATSSGSGSSQSAGNNNFGQQTTQTIPISILTALLGMAQNAVSPTP